MLITRRSPLTGDVNTLEIDVSEHALNLWKSGMPIQTAMPDLSSDEREFILSGLTKEDWKTMFGEEN